MQRGFQRFDAGLATQEGLKAEIGVAIVHAFGALLQTNIDADKVKSLQASLLPLYYVRGSKAKSELPKMHPLKDLSRVLAAIRFMTLVGVMLTHELVGARETLVNYVASIREAPIPSNINHALGVVLQLVQQENERGHDAGMV